MFCKLWGCECGKVAELAEETQRQFRGLLDSIGVWMHARGDLEEHDQKFLYALKYHIGTGLDSGDTSTDVSYPNLEHASSWGKDQPRV